MNLKNDSGFGLVNALMSASALVVVALILGNAIQNQRKNLVYQESRTGFIQGRLALSELVRTQGSVLCVDLGYGPDQLLPKDEKILSFIKDSSVSVPLGPEYKILENKNLLDESFSQNRSIATVKEVLPLGIAPYVKLNSDKFSCLPDLKNPSQEICKSELLFFAGFPTGKIQPKPDDYAITFRVNKVVSPSVSRTVASCEMGNALPAVAIPEANADSNFERVGIIPKGAQDFDLGGDFKRVTFLGHLESGDASPFGGFITRQSDNSMRAVLTAEGRFYGDFILNATYRCIWLDGKIYPNKSDSPVCLKVDDQGNVRLKFAPYMRTSFVAEGLNQVPALIPLKSEPEFVNIEGIHVFAWSSSADVIIKCPAGKKVVPGSPFASLTDRRPRIIESGDGIACNSSGAYSCRCYAVCY